MQQACRAIIGIDVASIKVGVAILNIGSFEPLVITTLAANAKAPVADRLAHLQRGVEHLIFSTLVHRHIPLAIVALEKPDDRFAADHHTTAFVLGRAYQHFWSFARHISVPVYEVSPGESSEAVGCRQRNASKAVRNRACATILQGTWDNHRKKGVVVIEEAHVEVDHNGLDAYAAACAGIGKHKEALLERGELICV
jgi:Holliday junction resolvasome RuvABC endonuclease subunit